MRSPAVRPKSRLHGLDALRGLAAIAVVFNHYTFRYPEVMPGHPLSAIRVVNGHFGVNLFFIISGFVIFLSLEHSKSSLDFAVARFARLWPPYVACACLTLAVIVFAHFNPFGLTVKAALLNIPMMSKLLGTVPIDGSYWTLTYEVLFYCLAALVFFGFRIRRIEWPGLAWLAIAFIARVSGFNEHHVRIGVLLGVDFCHLFVLGMMIYLVWQRRHTALTLVTAGLCFAMTLFGPYYNPGKIELWQFMLMNALFGLGVWLAAESRFDVWYIRPLVFLGEISYSLYLVHQIAGYWLITRMEDRGWNPNVAVLATIGVAICVAVVVRRLVEVPAQRVIRDYYRKTIQVSRPARASVPV